MPVTTQRDQLVDEFWGLVDRGSGLGRVLARLMGIHVTDAAAIVVIIRADDDGQPLTPNKLSARIELTTGATSILLNRLEDAGLLERRRGHADRRRVTLHPTATVRAAIAAFQDPVRADLEHVLDDYTPAELELVARFIDDFRAVVEAHHRQRPA